MFELKKNPISIIIAGTGAGWELMPRITEKTIYCLNDYVYSEKYQVRPDMIFIMDVLDEKPQIVTGISNLGDVISRINAMKVPLISPFKYEEIPLSEPFPLEECVKEFGLPYFSNTISYMIAYALLRGARELNLYGINQASSSEYFYEKAGVEYWLGIAIGRGVKVTIHGDKSELLGNKARFGGSLLYGYNMNYQSTVELKQKFGAVVHRLAAPAKQFSRTIRKIN